MRLRLAHGYDALPNPGYACGHKIVFTEGHAAVLGLAAAMRAGKSSDNICRHRSGVVAVYLRWKSVLRGSG